MTDDDAAKRTGWRFVRSEASGSFVRDPEGTDRPPPGYLIPPDEYGERERDEARRVAAEIEAEQRLADEQRRAFAASVRQAVFQMFGGPPVGDRIGPGRCDDCGRTVEDREQFGRVQVCLDDLRRRLAAVVVTNLHTPAPSWTGWRREGERFIRDPQGVDQPPSHRGRPPAPPMPGWRYWRKEPRPHNAAGRRKA